MEFAASGTYCPSARLTHEAFVTHVFLQQFTTASEKQIARCC